MGESSSSLALQICKMGSSGLAFSILPGGLAWDVKLLLLLGQILASDYLMTSYGTLTSSDGTGERESGSRFVIGSSNNPFFFLVDQLKFPR